MYAYDKPDNLVEMFENSVTQYPDKPLFGTKNPQGTYDWVTYEEVAKRVDNLRGGLAQLGVGKDDAVGIISRNSVEWAVAAFATYGLGARFISMYETEVFRIWKYIVADSAIKVLFVATPVIYEQVRGFLDEISTLEKIIVIDGDAEDSMAALEQVGQQHSLPSMRPGPYGVAGLIYTSGTTGEPKGVLLTHGNFTSNARAGYKIYPELNHNSRSLSILPWAHSYGQVAELYNFIQFGGSIGLAESPNTIITDIAQVKPTHLLAVPRVFNRIYNGLWAKMDEAGGLPRRLFVMGVESGKKRRALAKEGRSSFWTELQFKIADRIVFEKVRELFGGRLQCAMTASAAMNVDIAHFFFDVGIPLYDVYGLTECSPAVAMNCPAAFRLGSVGQAIDKVTIVIDKSAVEAGADDGEIVVYGPNVMQGYHNKLEATRAIMTEDGGIRTGDRGRLDEDGYLYITGRIKEQYKLENGRFVFPASLEEDIKLIPYIANAMIYGENRAYNVCLVVPDFAVLEKYAVKHNLPTDPAALVQRPEVRDLISTEIREFLTGKYRNYEIPHKFVLLTEDFTLENGMLTQTMKLKRRAVVEKYKAEIEAQYA